MESKPNVLRLIGLVFVLILTVRFLASINTPWVLLAIVSLAGMFIIFGLEFTYSEKGSTKEGVKTGLEIFKNWLLVASGLIVTLFILFAIMEFVFGIRF